MFKRTSIALKHVAEYTAGEELTISYMTTLPSSLPAVASERGLAFQSNLTALFDVNEVSY
jgi:hypothetical protein